MPKSRRRARLILSFHYFMANSPLLHRCLHQARTNLFTITISYVRFVFTGIVCPLDPIHRGASLLLCLCSCQRDAGSRSQSGVFFSFSCCCLLIEYAGVAVTTPRQPEVSPYQFQGRSLVTFLSLSLSHTHRIHVVTCCLLKYQMC